LAKHLKDEDVERVVELLDGWSQKLTWEALCDACVAVISTRPTRQTLAKYSRIKNAYAECKARQKTGRRQTEGASDLKSAIQRIERLQNENERLARENRELLEQFVIWQYNAHVKGLTDFDLNKPMPSIDRSPTN
jgi:predicted RNase H-like nuclease (RuvC/YqgF family)